jgi:hypothetical protein
MRRNRFFSNKLFILGAIVFPFLVPSVFLLSPDLAKILFAALEPLFLQSRQFLRQLILQALQIFQIKGTPEATGLDSLIGWIMLCGLSIAPGLLCLLCFIKRPLNRLIGGLIYILIAPPLIYIYVVLIGLKRGGYI